MRFMSKNTLTKTLLRTAGLLGAAMAFCHPAQATDAKDSSHCIKVAKQCGWIEQCKVVHVKNDQGDVTLKRAYYRTTQPRDVFFCSTTQDVGFHCCTKEVTCYKYKYMHYQISVRGFISDAALCAAAQAETIQYDQLSDDCFSPGTVNGKNCN